MALRLWRRCALFQPNPLHIGLLGVEMGECKFCGRHVAPATQMSVAHTSSMHILSTCNASGAQDTHIVSPYIANVPHRTHAACHQPTVCPPALLSTSSHARKPAEGRARLAEKALGALGVEADSKHSARTVPRRVESCSALGAAIGASIDAVPSGRPAKVGRTASSAGGL